MIKYLVLYYYDSKIDVLAVCDTHEQPYAKMREDYESFFESVRSEGENYYDIDSYITLGSANVTSEFSSCHWDIVKIKL